jgi:alcohol dehydrogenase
MKAARLHQIGSPLQVETTADPSLRSGSTIVRILSSHIPAFTQKVFSGELGYMLPQPFPFIPGTSAIGIIEAIADDVYVFGLQIGQVVFCDPFIGSPTISAAPNAILLGWTGLAPESSKLQAIWKEGTWAEKVLLPAETLTPVPEMPNFDPIVLAAIGYLAIPYGGFKKGQFRPGQQVIVNGATGGLGTAAILVALAMGASRIIAVGRDQTTLTKLEQLNPQRVVGAQFQGKTDRDRLLQLAQGTDLVIDTLGGVTTSEQTLACIQALRPSGTAVFMGGVQTAIPLPYAEIMLKEITICGAFMYPRSAPGELLQMVKGGTLRLDAIQTYKFPLTEINEAVDRAATLKGLDYCILAMNNVDR